MLHFVNVFMPREDRESKTDDQKSFFGPDWRLSRGERDAALLNGKLPAEADEADRSAFSPRFVTLLSPPFL